MKRADAARPSRTPHGAEPRFEIDGALLLRVAAVAVIVALLVLIAKVSMMAFGGAGKRLERLDPGQEQRSVQVLESRSAD